MRIVNVHEAKTHFSRILDAVVAGEDVVIAKAGIPYVRLVAVAKRKRTPGAAKGKGRVTEAFFEPLSEEDIERWQ